MSKHEIYLDSAVLNDELVTNSKSFTVNSLNNMFNVTQATIIE